MRYMLLCKVAELPPAGGPHPTPNDQLQMNFYCRLGIFMATWQFVESGLSRVYFKATRAPAESYNGLKAAFYRNTSFNGRLEMTNDVIKHSSLDATLKGEWDEIKKTLKSYCEKRNKVAHGIVYWAPYEEVVPDNELFVGDNFDNPKYADCRNRYYFSDLEKMSKEFETANGALHALFLKLPYP